MSKVRNGSTLLLNRFPTIPDLECVVNALKSHVVPKKNNFEERRKILRRCFFLSRLCPITKVRKRKIFPSGILTNIELFAGSTNMKLTNVENKTEEKILFRKFTVDYAGGKCRTFMGFHSAIED